MKEQLQPLEQPQADLFVDRGKELAKYWDWATSIPGRHANSHALIGRRRTGRTAILSFVYLQDHAAIWACPSSQPNKII